MHERVAPSWRAVEAIPVAVVALMATAVAALLLSAALSEGWALILIGLAFEVSLGGMTLLWVGLRYRGAVPALGLPSSRPSRDVLAGLLYGVGLFFLTVLVVAPVVYTLIRVFTGDPVTPPQQEVLPENPDSVQVALGGLVVVLGAPVGEELFFRGLLFGALRRRHRFAVAATVSAAVFAVFHVLPLLMPLLFVVGLGLAYVYERRGSLLASMAAHAGFNVVGYLFIVQAS